MCLSQWSTRSRGMFIHRSSVIGLILWIIMYNLWRSTSARWNGHLHRIIQVTICRLKAINRYHFIFIASFDNEGLISVRHYMIRPIIRSLKRGTMRVTQLYHSYNKLIHIHRLLSRKLETS